MKRLYFNSVRAVNLTELEAEKMAKLSEFGQSEKTYEKHLHCI
jgi:hypothetical protein